MEVGVGLGVVLAPGRQQDLAQLADRMIDQL
jgi:hypothetical protein